MTLTILKYQSDLLRNLQVLLSYEQLMQGFYSNIYEL